MKILYFDIAAIMIVPILLMSLYFRKMLDGRVNKFLAWLLSSYFNYDNIGFMGRIIYHMAIAKGIQYIVPLCVVLSVFFIPQSDYAALSTVYLCNYRYMAYSCEK